MPGSHPSFLAVLNLHLFSLLTLLLFLRIMGSKSQAMNVIFQLSYCQTCSGCPAALGALPAPVANKPWISTAVLNTMILYQSQKRHGDNDSSLRKLHFECWYLSSPSCPARPELLEVTMRSAPEAPPLLPDWANTKCSLTGTCR